MHPDSWLETLLGSRARVRLLRVLCLDPARVWTERELAHAVEMSPNTVNVAVAQLRDAGVLDFHRVGRTHAIRLRSGLGVVDHLRLIFAAETGTWDAIAKRIEQALPPGVACYLYGSTARKTAGRRSDIDILVVARDQEKAMDAAGSITEAARTVFPTGYEVVAMTVKDLRSRKRGAFVQNVIKDGLQIGPTSLEALL